MAVESVMNELTLHADTGQTIYARIYNTSGQLWNGVTFETWNGANVGDYDVPLTDRGSGIYQADFPAAAAGRYYVAYFNQISGPGGSPATDDYLVSANEQPFVWDGSAEVPLATYSDIEEVLATLTTLISSIGGTLFESENIEVDTYG